MAQRRTIAHLLAILKHTVGNGFGKLYGTGCKGLYYLSRGQDKKQRTDIRLYSFVNRTIRTGANYMQKR